MVGLRLFRGINSVFHMGIFNQNIEGAAEATNLLPDSDFRKHWLFPSMIRGGMLMSGYDHRRSDQIRLSIQDKKLIANEDILNLVVTSPNFKNYFPSVTTFVTDKSSVIYSNPNGDINNLTFPNLTAKYIGIKAKSVRNMELNALSGLSPIEFTNTRLIENCIIKTNSCTLGFVYGDMHDWVFPVIKNVVCPFLNRIIILIPADSEWCDSLGKFIHQSPLKIWDMISKLSASKIQKFNLFNYKPTGNLLRELGLTEYKDLYEIRIYLDSTYDSDAKTPKFVQMVRFNSDLTPLLLPECQAYFNMCTDDGWLIGYSSKN